MVTSMSNRQQQKQTLRFAEDYNQRDSGPVETVTMIVVLMGVSGSGKTTIGTLLATREGVVFADADDYHPAANKAKMAAGHALDDDDRQPVARGAESGDARVV